MAGRMQRRRAYHKARLDAAPDNRTRLWAAFNWLAAEAHHHDRLHEVYALALNTIRKLQNGRPL
jgi:hypothetical protein